MAKIKLYSREIKDGVVSIGYEQFEVKDHVLEIPEEVAQGWEPGPLWGPYQPKKQSKGVKADDSETEQA